MQDFLDFVKNVVNVENEAFKSFIDKSTTTLNANWISMVVSGKNIRPSDIK